jgi:hypothetical protein
MKQFFDFEKGIEFNPAKTLNYFFISPYKPDNARLINLEKKVIDKLGNDFSFTWYRGMPVAVFPIEVLDLGKCVITWESIENGIIHSGNIKYYFRFVDAYTVRIDTILC